MQPQDFYTPINNPGIVAPVPALIDEVALAKLYGEPLFKVPADLYIPPDALTIFLDAFEGPLDLLLYLIRKQNFNILDIPMAQLTLQYLDYVDQIRDQNLELAAEYLLMAAMLIEIKSRMLLPIRTVESDGETFDPRAELVRKLLEYEKIKIAARQIDELPRLNRDFFSAQVFVNQETAIDWPKLNILDLQNAWKDICQRVKLLTHHAIVREQLSVREQMANILRRLRSARFIEFSEFFDRSSSTSLIVVNFIALLELAKESLISVTQAEAYAPIYVRLAYAEN